MRWEKYGWQLSRITNMFTNSSPTPRPRVFKKFNYRIIWADGGSNQGVSKKLSVENYRHGSDACYELMGNRYLAQSLWRERALDPSADYPPYRPWFLPCRT